MIRLSFGNPQRAGQKTERETRVRGQTSSPEQGGGPYRHDKTRFLPLLKKSKWPVEEDLPGPSTVAFGTN